MNVIPIDDPADPRLDAYRDLRHEDVRRRGSLFIAEGKLVVQRLLQSRYPADSILTEQNRLAAVAPYVGPATPIYVVTSELIQEVAGFAFHRGLLACGQRVPFSPIEELLPSSERKPMALAAISLNDLENLGSLLRTAAALGIFRIALNRQTADPLCRRVLRVSMGAALKMQFFDLVEPLTWLQRNRHCEGWQTIAMTLVSDSIPLQQAVKRTTRAKMIVMGNEGDGLPEAIQQACHIRAKIPMAPGIDSLNVAVAGAIALYEFTRDSV